MLGPAQANEEGRLQEPDNFDGRIPAMTFEEHERSQRFMRLLMMLLMLLILMDGGQEPSRNNRPIHESMPYLRSGIKSAFLRGQLDGLWSPVSLSLFERRRRMDHKIHSLTSKHPRSRHLIALNHDRDEEQLIRSNVIDVVKRSFNVDDSLADMWSDTDTTRSRGQNNEVLNTHLLPDSNMVYYYPKNSTGFYRGYWRRIEESEVPNRFGRNISGSGEERNKKVPSSSQAESLAGHQSRDIGVYLIPRSTERMYNFTSVTDTLISQYDEVLAQHDFKTESSDIALNMPNGYIKIQLLSRPVPAMDELSLVDGFVKIFDGNYTTFSSAQGLLLRVRGVVIHSIGKISLVANDGLRNQSALILYGEDDGYSTDESMDDFSQKRKLRDLKRNLQDIRNTAGGNQDWDIQNIRDDALVLFADFWNEANVGGNAWTDYPSLHNPLYEIPYSFQHCARWMKRFAKRNGTTFLNPIFSTEDSADHRRDTDMDSTPITRKLESMIEEPFNRSIPNRIRLHEPFVPDDDQMKSLDLSSMGRLASHEKDLFLNGINCDFEMNVYVQVSRWTVAEWRRSLYMAALRVIFSSPTVEVRETDFNSSSPFWMGDFFLISDIGKKSKTGNLVMSFSGLIESPNCAFYSIVQAEALRIDWDRTAGKAVSYSFYMVLLCVFEIVLYLQQLLHSQAQSTASRVSIICIAWQTIIDAMICIGHLIFSVVIQPLFSAFAMISFFKLLIFSVIEMKYMAMILHARNSSDNNAVSNRRRVGWLQFFFYSSLIVGIIVFTLIMKENLILSLLLLYSFWLPQILLNIFTQANKPLHRNFIYGMSLTRLFVPLYMFGVPNSYIHDIEPEFPVDGHVCVALLIWVSFQVIVLLTQSVLGSRFMIPRFCLPPKYNYHRDIPQSLLHQHTPNNGHSGLDADGELQTSLLAEDNNHTVVHSGPRNRLKSRPKSKDEIFETGLDPAIDCVICYNRINITEPKSYMLAPCDHIFHTECMSQWMNVKMECPICRMELPPA